MATYCRYCDIELRVEIDEIAETAPYCSYFCKGHAEEEAKMSSSGALPPPRMPFFEMPPPAAAPVSPAGSGLTDFVATADIKPGQWVEIDPAVGRLFPAGVVPVSPICSGRAGAGTAIKHGSVETKPTNPKDAIGSDKLPLHLWPETATATGCLALLDGMLKYGRLNFRAIGVRSTIYVDACKRHLNAWLEGHDNDDGVDDEGNPTGSGLPHLSHALACIAIIVDAQAAGKLNDDRQFEGGYIELLKELTPHVARLKALHAGKDPKHYTIADDPQDYR